MDYLIKGISNKKMIPICQKFINDNQDIIEDVLLMRKPQIKPMFDVKTKAALEKEIDKYIHIDDEEKKHRESYIMMVWRYYCCSFPEVKLLVLDGKKLAKKDEKNCLYDFHKKISEHALDGILLQIAFSKLKFNDMIEYLFKKYKDYKNVDLSPFDNLKNLRNHEINVYVMRKIEGKYEPLYESNDFYELVEGSKIFLHLDNYVFYEEQLKFAFANKMNDAIRIFFLLKFFKIYLYKKTSLLFGEFFALGGSFYFFSLGLRESRDVDVVMIYKKDVDKFRKDMSCQFEIIDGSIIEKMILNPELYSIYFGFKGYMKKYEFGKRIHRYSVTKSKKTLGDIYILNYYFNMGKKIVIKNLEKLLFFRYNNFTKKILSHQMS
jgi:hypothetical protein